MLISYWLLLPLGLQTLLAVLDERLFHTKRGLPRWERLGHPLDTLTVAACFAWILLLPPRPPAVAGFAALALFSTLFVTKDEWIHHRCCGVAEHWIHACLFLLHPLVLLGAGFVWPAAHGLSIPVSFVSAGGFERALLNVAFCGTLVFAAYQFIFWNLLWRGSRTG
jgi:hypothetical protein